MSNNDGYQVVYEYTVRFYPRYFSWVQFHAVRSAGSRCYPRHPAAGCCRC